MMEDIMAPSFREDPRSLADKDMCYSLFIYTLNVQLLPTKTNISGFQLFHANYLPSCSCVCVCARARICAKQIHKKCTLMKNQLKLLYVCIHTIHACKYKHMNVCMNDAYIHTRMYICMHAYIHGWMDRCIHVCTDACI